MITSNAESEFKVVRYIHWPTLFIQCNKGDSEAKKLEWIFKTPWKEKIENLICRSCRKVCWIVWMEKDTNVPRFHIKWSAYIFLYAFCSIRANFSIIFMNLQARGTSEMRYFLSTAGQKWLIGISSEYIGKNPQFWLNANLKNGSSNVKKSLRPSLSHVTEGTACNIIQKHPIKICPKACLVRKT